MKIETYWCPICDCFESFYGNKHDEEWKLDLFLDISNWMKGKSIYE